MSVRAIITAAWGEAGASDGVLANALGKLNDLLELWRVGSLNRG